MEKFKISFEYFSDGVSYRSNQFETEQYSMNITANTDHVKLVVNTKGAPLEKLKFKLITPYEFNANDRVFLNGYQSWTDCREYFTDEQGVNMPSVRLVPLLFSPLGASGDYNFKKYDSLFN